MKKSERISKNRMMTIDELQKGTDSVSNKFQVHYNDVLFSFPAHVVCLYDNNPLTLPATGRLVENVSTTI